MNALRSSVASLALCSLFVSSAVRADDCSESLMAESCACQSDVRSEREQLPSSDKNSQANAHRKARRSARMRVAQRAKRDLAPSDRVMPASD